MTWLTWRQFRIPAASVFAALAAIGVVLAITGPQLVGRTDVSNEDTLYVGTVLVLYLLPAVVGVFWGVPMVTREVETGTHNLVWNQTVTRDRWLAAKLGVGVVAAMLAAGLLSLAVGWWASPIDSLAIADSERSLLTRMSPVVFGARGIVPIGYAAFAFVLGIAVGILLRRTLTAMAVTLVVFAAVQLAIPFLVRPYLLPATQETVTVTTSNVWQIRGDGPGVLEEVTVEKPAGAWVLDNKTVDRNGSEVGTLPAAMQQCLPSPDRDEAPQDHESMSACIAQGFADLGYRQHIAYQPATHFWPLQWLETALYLALSALLTWFCFRRLRHLS